ncbi:hypothetical protein C8R44DRAFT_860409 [Mycena epipterygia]|nr:hypothetical protein C8R44DRAFT_860409 [Mycena epipterygia]
MGVSAILSMPTEIIQRIMLLANTGPPQPVPQQAPFVISHVCKELRNITLDTPELWQSTAIDSTRTGSVSPNSAIVGLFLSRAANRPRDMSFTSRNPDEGKKLLEESLAYCQHWRDVQLRLPLESFSLLVAQQGPFPMLRSLSLSSTSYGPTAGGTRTLKICAASSLRTVTLPDFPILAVDVAWDQLTILRMTTTTQDAGAGISALQCCSNLVDLQFTIMDPDRSPLPSIPPFTLPSLRSFMAVGKPILSFLTAPSLTRLQIFPGSLGDMEELTDQVRALLERSQCPLEGLSFGEPNITAAEFRSFLQVVPMAVDLQFSLYFPSGLEKLVTVLQEDDILPRLVTLRIIHTSTGDTFESLLDLLCSRRQLIQGRATLEAFYLFGPSTPSPAVRTKLLALENEGMHISID